MPAVTSPVYPSHRTSYDENGSWTREYQSGAAPGPGAPPTAWAWRSPWVIWLSVPLVLSGSPPTSHTSARTAPARPHAPSSVRVSAILPVMEVTSFVKPLRGSVGLRTFALPGHLGLGARLGQGPLVDLGFDE